MSIEELSDKVNSLNICEEQSGRGEWLPDHPWGSENKPDPDLKMLDTVYQSSTHPISSEWLQKSSKKSSKQVVDLAKIYSNLPKFVSVMQGAINGSRQELEELVQKIYKGDAPLLERLSDLPPHTREIVGKFQRGSQAKGQRSLPNDRCFKAVSLKPIPYLTLLLMLTSKEKYFHLDCEYMLNIYLPNYSLQWFNNDDQEGRRITEINPEKKDARWIFIPSFRGAKIALLDWPEDDIVREDSTIKILVVRPSEFKEYVKYCGHQCPIICLPQDEIGVGYPRYWIQKIALRLKLHFIWMIDDSVECFYEYHPEQEPPKPGCYSEYRRRKFGLVFKRIEDFVKETDGKEKPIAAMSPRRFNGRYRLKTPFVCKPPQCAVYLNLRALSDKNVNYRPELKTFEDMIFGYECEQNGLKVYMDNRVHLQDKKWKDTGARSPSVKSK